MTAFYRRNNQAAATSRQAPTGEESTASLPSWSQLLVEAVERPGRLMKAYSAFHHYSIGNMLLALQQCEWRGLDIGPVNTFRGWLALGRAVRKGERALTLCMPITVKRGGDDEAVTTFVFKPRWFVLAQTEGEDAPPPPLQLPAFDAARALAELRIERVAFVSDDWNRQGYANRGTRQIAVSPVAQMPHKTLFHEAAHVVLGHTAESDFDDSERAPQNLREVEAEAVTLLCCESLGLEGAEFCRGYIQHWLGAGEHIPEASAQRIFRAADRLLKAGAPPPEA